MKKGAQGRDRDRERVVFISYGGCVRKRKREKERGCLLSFLLSFFILSNINSDHPFP